MSIRLVQISDLHLGRSFASLGVAPEVRDALRTASRAALRQAIELAHSHAAAALLIPGDLFDRPEMDDALLADVRELFGAAERPILVSPGNHDPLTATSVWNGATLARLGLPTWPDNVHIFSSRDFTPFPVGDGALVVHGHSVVGTHGVEDSPFNKLRIPNDDATHVLCFHGALNTGGRLERGTLPFTAEQLGASGITYAAVGHYHSYTPIEHAGRVWGAYAGVPVPGDLGETGVGGVLLVELNADGPQLELVRPCPTRIIRAELAGEPPFDGNDDAAARIRAWATAENVTAADLVYLTMTGFSARALALDALRATLADGFRHLSLDDDTLPEPTGAEHGRVTVESQFLNALSRAIEAARDDTERGVLEAARRYGLLALRGRDVRPPRATTTDGGC